MTASPIPVQLVLSATGLSIGQLPADSQWQPGQQLWWANQSYIVLERRHRYGLRAGQYHLLRAVLYLQPQTTTDRSTPPEALGIGDENCRFNAIHPLLRCAVRPLGPCQDCPDYRPRPGETID